MADIINLNQVRKVKQRQEDKKKASENRVRFGRSGAEKRRLKVEEIQKQSRLDGAKIDDPSKDKAP